MGNSLETALLCAEGAQSKKAFDVQILDLRKLTYLADFFVICSGSNTTQVGAIADAVGETLAKAGVRYSHVEGQEGATWILMDYGDVIVHVFEEQTRIYYALDKLWNDAPRMPLPESTGDLLGAAS